MLNYKDSFNKGMRVALENIFVEIQRRLGELDEGVLIKFTLLAKGVIVSPNVKKMYKDMVTISITNASCSAFEYDLRSRTLKITVVFKDCEDLETAIIPIFAFESYLDPQNGVMIELDPDIEYGNAN